MAQAPKKVVQNFARVKEGSFVQLENCKVRLPTYVQSMQAAQSPGFDWTDPAGFGGSATNPVTAPIYTSQTAEFLAGRRHGMTGAGAGIYPVGAVQKIDDALHELIKAAGPNPRVPMATCDGNADEVNPRGIDLLFPLQLANSTPEPGLISRPVTVVGKLVLTVRNKDSEYVDNASLTTFSKALIQLDGAEHTGTEQLDELYADTVVLPPGAVIIPIAIYG